VLTKFVPVLTLAALMVISAARCAKIAEPQPPQVRIPKPATDLSARQLSDRILLTFSMPSQNTDGSPVSSLKSVDIYRLVESSGPREILDLLSDEEFLEKAVRIISISANEFSTYLHGQKFLVEDRIDSSEEILPDHLVFRYAVLFLNKKNQTAGLSNQVLITPVRIVPPASPAAEVTEDFVRLSWTPPLENMEPSSAAEMPAYNIYRWEKGNKPSLVPINPEPVSNPVFEDRNFEFSKTYFYAVTAVIKRQNTYAESRLSEPVEVNAQDTFPPLPPSHFAAIFDGRDIILLWTASPSKDVVGYRLFKITEGSNSPQALENEIISTLRYRDNHVDLKSRYLIVAVDAHGNESSPLTAAVEVP